MGSYNMGNRGVTLHQNADKPTIVILDDEVAILASIKSLFRKFPYRFNLFTSMNMALQQLRTGHVDIVISDLRMNETNGLVFMKEVMSIAPSAKRILMSGFEDKSVVLLALSTGLINHFIYKPWEDSEFIQLISKYIESLAPSKIQESTDILAGFEDIPSPVLFQEKLNQMLSDMNAPLSKIVEEIEKNPALVARLLRIANSVHLGIQKKVSSVRQAVLFIGLDYLSSVVTALEAFQSYSSKVTERYAGLIEEMSLTAVHRAMIAKEIAARWPGIESKYIPHVASLLQDIGLFARICLKPEMFDIYSKTVQDRKISPLEAELAVFDNSTHEKIGAAILDDWNFPSEIVDIVRAHHTQEASTDYMKIIQLAMLISDPTDDYPHDESLLDLVPEWRLKLGLPQDYRSTNYR
ncbi:MAG: response regulator [Bacteroidetes bacterium]|nr:response regulator [Bacteroidota bacterium]